MYFFGGFSLISPGFRPNSRALVPCFPDFTKNSTKHPENQCMYVLIPCQKIQLIPFEVFKRLVSNGRKPTGISSLYVKTSNIHSENRNENRPPLVSTCVCIRASPTVLNIWPEKIFFPSKFSYVLFHNPTHKTKTGTANRCGTTNSKPRGLIIMMGQPPQ
jgi:hypothetical protein